MDCAPARDTKCRHLFFFPLNAGGLDPRYSMATIVRQPLRARRYEELGAAVVASSTFETAPAGGQTRTPPHRAAPQCWHVSFPVFHGREFARCRPAISCVCVRVSSVPS